MPPTVYRFIRSASGGKTATWDAARATRMICGGVEALSPERTLAGEANPREWSAFWALERGGAGREFDSALEADEFTPS